MPICDKQYEGVGALSRVYEDVSICHECGKREAMVAYYTAEQSYGKTYYNHE